LPHTEFEGLYIFCNNFFSGCCSSTWRFCHILMTSSKLADIFFFSTSRILVAWEFSSLSVFDSVCSDKSQVWFLFMLDCWFVSLFFMGILSLSQVTIWWLMLIIMPDSPRRISPNTTYHVIVLDEPEQSSTWNDQEEHIWFLKVQLRWKCHKTSFIWDKLTTHCTPAGLFTVISLDE
jgi:hypothetical protein